MTPTDAELVNRCLRGERDAFDVLMRRYQRQVYALALSCVRNPEDAEDIAQDAFERAYSCLWSLKQPDRFACWISRIAFRCAAGWYRRRRETATEMEAMLQDIPDPTDGHAEVERREDTRRVYDDVWEMLTGEERPVFFLHEVAGMTIPEIAEALALSPDAVDQRRVRARHKIRERYERLGKLEEVIELVRSYGLTVAAGTELIARMLKSVSATPAQPPAPSAFRWFGYWTTGSVVVAGAVMGWAAWGMLKSDVLQVPVEKSFIEIRMMPPPKPRLVLVENLVNLRVGQTIPGWQAALPRGDTTLPILQATGGKRHPYAIMVRNDDGVFKKFPPVTGTVVIEMWVKPSLTRSNLIIGALLDVGNHLRDFTRPNTLLYKNETNHWFAVNHHRDRANTAVRVDLGGIRGAGQNVKLIYRTFDASYDVYLDGRHVARGVRCAGGQGEPVRGIWVNSGRGGKGRAAYLNDLRVSVHA